MAAGGVDARPMFEKKLAVVQGKGEKLTTKAVVAVPLSSLPR